eukprot:gene1936-2201_t
MQVFYLPEVPSEGELEMFENDTEHYVIGNSADEISVSIEDVFQEINQWCKQNCLTIHPDKTEVMMISRKTIVGPLRPIKLQDHIVKYVAESKCLGMTVDNRLSWKNHIKKASVNLGKKVKQLKRMRSLPAKVLETIYFRGILLSTTIGIGVWGSCSPQQLKGLERVHRKVGRIIHKIPKGVPQDQILEQAKWKSISFMYKKRIAYLAHQASNRKHPDVINDLVARHVTNKNLRDNIKLEIQRSKTNAEKQSFRHRGPLIWNSLPEIAKAFKTASKLLKIQIFCRALPSAVSRALAYQTCLTIARCFLERIRSLKLTLQRTTGFLDNTNADTTPVNFILAYDEIHRRVELGERPLYRPFEWNREERDKAKKNRVLNWYKNGKYDSVIFIQSTPGSELKRKYQNEIDRCGVRIRVVEKAGRSLKSQLQRSVPFKEASCNRETCLICKTGGRGSCSKDGINYEIACVGCEQQGRDMKYHGESSKNGFTRGKQHLEELDRRSESSIAVKIDQLEELIVVINRIRPVNN